MLAALAAGTLSLFASGCTKAPVTGRRQFNLVPDAVMLPLGQSAYQDSLSGANLEKGTTDQKTLKGVGKRISKVANEPDYNWRYSLIDDAETINAWCLPGGKIAFYTGILPVVRNEAGMSFVMGHEVGHATAHHSAERLSQQLAVIGGLGAVNLYIQKKSDLSDKQRSTILAALGVGAEVGMILPFSRKHEKEADIIGMMYMARAGYPPQEALDVWDRMEKETGGSSTPVFLSTHPSNPDRQANLKDWMPQAKKRYQRNKLQADTQKALWNGSKSPKESKGSGSVTIGG